MDSRTVFQPTVRAGDLTFLAQDARDADGRLGSAWDSAAQTATVLEQLATSLRATRQALDDLVFLQVLLADYAALDAVAAVLAGAFADPLRAPATCVLGVSSLDGDCAVRVDAIASRAERAAIIAPDVPLARGARNHGVIAGDLCFLSGIDAGEIAQAPASNAEMGRQTAAVLDRMDRVLATQGLSLGNVGRTFMFMADLRVRPGYADSRRARYQGIFDVDRFPANSGIGIPRLGPKVLLRSVAIAGRQAPRYVSSDKVRLSPGSFSQAVALGPWLFMAGQDAIGLDQQTLALGNVAEQTTISLQHLKDIVEAADGRLEDIVKTTLYVVEGEDLAVALEAYQRFFAAHTRGPWLPSGLTLGVMELATDCLVEIDAVAYLGRR